VAAAIGEKAEVTDPDQAFGQHMQQEATDELSHVQRHHRGLMLGVEEQRNRKYI
jgi:hypothetical protein